MKKDPGKKSLYIPTCFIWSILGSLLIWLTGIFSAPLLAASADPLLLKISTVLYYFYQPVCHQIAERSFLINGFALAVCVRCLGVYFGGLAVTIFYLFKTKINLWPLGVYAIMASPAVFDFIVEKIVIYDPTGFIRFLSGLLLGITIFQLFILSLKVIRPDYTKLKTVTRKSNNG